MTHTVHKPFGGWYFRIGNSYKAAMSRICVSGINR